MIEWQYAVNRWIIEKSYKKSIKDDIYMLGQIAGFWGKDKDIKSLSGEDVYKLRKYLKKRKLSNATINRYMSVLKSLLNIAKDEWEWIVRFPKIKMLPEQPRERIATSEEIAQLYLNLPAPYNSILNLTVNTGLRWTNASSVTYAHFKDDGIYRVLHFERHEMKAGKPLTIPLNRPAYAAALAIAQYNSKNPKKKQLQSKVWQKAIKECGINDLRWHDLRHTFASNKAKDGVPIEIISRLLGHSSITTTDRYRHLNVGDLRRYI